MPTDENVVSKDFIRDLIDADNRSGRFGGRVHTRFPPEPNGYLHIGHAMSINLNYGIAREYGGKFNLRFDDTNPAKEEQEYVDSILADARWLGVDWEDRLFFASDYFDQLYAWAVQLIRAGKAYVCDLNADEIREYRGTLTEPGRESPYRNRTVEENLALFQRPFGRIEIAGDRYFTNLIYYIHYNPQKHGLADDFRAWPHSSYPALLSAQPTRLAREEVLAWFGGAQRFAEAHRLSLPAGPLAPLIGDDA